MKKYAFPLAALLLAACNSGEEITTTQTDEPVARILEYTPAPGQFINEEARSGGAFDNVDTPEKACRYAAARFAENNWVSLGGWGGYPSSRHSPSRYPTRAVTTFTSRATP